MHTGLQERAQRSHMTKPKLLTKNGAWAAITVAKTSPSRRSKSKLTIQRVGGTPSGKETEN